MQGRRYSACEMSAPSSDEELMLSYAAGSADSFDTLYARHKGGVYRYLLRQCSNRSIADELFQDVWMNAIRARARYAPTAKFTTWLYTLARNRLIDHWRSTGSAHFSSLDEENEDGESRLESLPSADGDPRAGLETAQVRERLQAALATLPTAQRDAFLLQQEGGLSLAEIATLTGVGQETVKSRLRYAIGKLRGDLAALREDLR